VLFWIGLAIMVITSMLRNWREHQAFLSITQWGLLTENIWELAISDLTMAATTYLCLPLHMLYRNSKLFRWHNLGAIVQSIFQIAWLAHWVG
jgi:sterol O-acyltransferase